MVRVHQRIVHRPPSLPLLRTRQLICLLGLWVALPFTLDSFGETPRCPFSKVAYEAN